MHTLQSTRSRLIVLVIIHTAVATVHERSYGNWSGPPDLFFLGAPKAGTTALHEYLTDFANVCGGVMKEYHYWEFRHENEHSYRTYEKGFSKCNEGQLTLDASPSNGAYLSTRNIFGAFSKENFKKKRFVYVFREPLDRMLSWYNFELTLNSLAKCDQFEGVRNENCEKFKEKRKHLDSFKEYFESNPYTGVPAGSYLNMLKYALYDVRRSGGKDAHYPLMPRHQLFIMNFDALKLDPADILKRLNRFLGVSANSYELPRVNDIGFKLGMLGIEKQEMKCKDYLHFKPIFDKKNEGLADFINSHPDKPPDEPEFLQFIDLYAKQCNQPGALKGEGDLYPEQERK